MGRAEERSFNLDVLRGIAIALVLVRHMPVEPTRDEVVTRALFEIGWSGVDLFFVLSGFLISTLLFAEISSTGRIQLQRFWLRRGLRIWPAYFAVYGCFAVARLLLGRPASPWRDLPNLLMLQNYFPDERRWPHSWSLAVEEHFYLVLPLLLTLLVKLGRLGRGRKSLPIAAGGLCAMVLLARYHGANAPDAVWKDFYYPSHYRADSLLFGVLLGYAYHYYRSEFRRVAAWGWPFFLAAAASAVGFAWLHPLEEPASPSYTIGFTLLYLGYGGAVAWAAAYPGTGERNWLLRALANLGLYSYSIYLTHSVVLRFSPVARAITLLREQTFDSPWIERTLFWGLSIATGYAVARLVERPFLRLRSRWLPMSAPDFRGAVSPAEPPGWRGSAKRIAL